MEYLNYKDGPQDSAAGCWPSKHKVLSSSLSIAQMKTIPDLSSAIRRGESLPISEECEGAVRMGRRRSRWENMPEKVERTGVVLSLPAQPRGLRRQGEAAPLTCSGFLPH